MEGKEPQASQAPVPGSQWSWGFRTVGCGGDQWGWGRSWRTSFPFLKPPPLPPVPILLSSSLFQISFFTSFLYFYKTSVLGKLLNRGKQIKLKFLKKLPDFELLGAVITFFWGKKIARTGHLEGYFGPPWAGFIPGRLSTPLIVLPPFLETRDAGGKGERERLQ